MPIRQPAVLPSAVQRNAAIERRFAEHVLALRRAGADTMRTRRGLVEAG